MIDEKKCYFFGRNKQLNDFCIDHASCSRVHAALVWHRHLNRPFIIDLNSSEYEATRSSSLQRFVPYHLNVSLHTLECLMNVPACLFISRKISLQNLMFGCYITNTARLNVLTYLNFGYKFYVYVFTFFTMSFAPFLGLIVYCRSCDQSADQNRCLKVNKNNLALNMCYSKS